MPHRKMDLLLTRVVWKPQYRCQRHVRNFYYHDWFVSGLTWHCFFVMLLVIPSCTAGGVTRTFPLQNSSSSFQFNHLVIDSRNGNIYIGAVNKLLCLDENLGHLAEVITGPVKDHPQCPPGPEDMCSDDKNQQIVKTLLPNYNKILSIDYSNGKLITCGSVYQGSCQVRLLNNITSSTSYTKGDFYYIAANDPRASTVGIITRGHSNKDVLFVGTTLSQDSTIRSSVPAVSTRKLSSSDTFNYLFSDELLGQYSRVMLTRQFRTEYTIKYVSGFTDSNFVYFLITQMHDSSSRSKTNVSKIIQLCKNDTKYHSYVEMPIQCISDGVSYNLVRSGSVHTIGGGVNLEKDSSLLVATFSNNSRQSGSAICVYQMSDLRRQFDQTIQNCAADRDLNIRKFVNTGPCPTNPTTCDHKARLVSTRVIREKSVITFPKVRVTSIGASLVNQKHVVLFLGTEGGHIKKIYLKNMSTAIEYSDQVIGNGAVSPDLPLDRAQQHLYVMTPNKIYKTAVQDCSSFKTCNTCRLAGDPYCGWCVLEARCTQISYCNDSNKQGRWLPMVTENDSEQCLVLNHVNPDIAPKAEETLINMSVTGLPEDETYFCDFISGNRVYSRMSTRSGNNINCYTPSAASLPANRPGEDHLNVTLALVSSAKIIVLQTPFTFYDCNNTTCSKCTARWPCRWCVHSNFCTHQSTCPASQPEAVTDDLKCPGIVGISQPLKIPHNVATQLNVAAKNLPSEKYDSDTGFECILNIENKDIRVPARRSSPDSLICNKKDFGYRSEKSSIDVGVKFIWNGREIEMSTMFLTVMLYKCSAMGTDCSSCLNRNVEYGCVWCSDRCTYNSSCNTANRECPVPTLTQVSPLTSPLEGGTRVTIAGLNLGKDISEIQGTGSVTLAGIPCTPIESEYVVSRRIVCLTSPVFNAVSGPVIVKIRNQVAKNWPERFSYRDPRVQSIFPVLGPRSGGTKVIIKGEYLNTGENISSYLGNASCVIMQKSDITASQITCWTSEVTAPAHMHTVSVHFDKGKRHLRQTFSYTSDPVIKGISPLKSFKSGGLDISVTGAELFTVQKPEMYIYNSVWESNHSVCIQQSNVSMICKSPPVRYHNQSNSTRTRRAATEEYSVGFIMDGVKKLRTLSAAFPDLPSTMIYYTDPKYLPFENNIKVYKGEALIIKGENLDSASNEKDVTVTIGKEKCMVTSLSPTSLVCRPPPQQPGAERGGGLPLVKVRVGNLLFEIGKLEYQIPIPMELIIGISAAGGFLILIIIFILIVYKRKSTKAGRAFKKLQIQLDTLESNVRNECKQAFAELQTDMSDLTSDLTASGIPYWEFKVYAFNVLFPGIEDHPVMQTASNNHIGSVELGLHQFSQLLNSKPFILVFIRTMESQESFSVRDRAVVASLLMIILMDKMDYATEILKALLNELIDKSVDKRHPKLMLRRTESVVEKLLTNWLSLCLYSHLKTEVGTPLFKLFKAIKLQIEKGPVDAVTSEARYSLSEDRLLREKIEPKTLTVNVETDVESQELVSVKVLDCDSITQAKEKMLDTIYKNTPYSHRPSVFDLDLEWRSGRSGHLILQDEDVISEYHGEWKRINTLAHYQVTDGATMALQTRQYELSKKRKGLGKPEHGISLNSIMALVNVDVEAGSKVWHLIKHQDDTHASARTHKVISEIFLTRLLSTKGTLQKFTDDLFKTILTANNNLPPAVKFLFDFLDKGAQRHNIADVEVVHTWKSNSLPLRFWVNIIKNPDFVFDVNKSPIVDSCLSVIAQTFMDSCSTSDHRLGKDSPTNKLLFAKDIPRYRKLVEAFYQDVKETPKVTDQDMAAAMIELSQTYPVDFHVTNALKELYDYANQYRFQIIEALEEDLTSQKLNLARQFEKIGTTIAGEVFY